MNKTSLEATHLLLAGKRVAARRIAAGSPLYRLFRYSGGDLSPAPAPKRFGRLDPPASRQGAYGILYASTSIITAQLRTAA